MKFIIVHYSINYDKLDFSYTHLQSLLIIIGDLMTAIFAAILGKSCTYTKIYTYMTLILPMAPGKSYVGWLVCVFTVSTYVYVKYLPIYLPTNL